MVIGPEFQSAAIAGTSPAPSRGERVDPVSAPESPGPDDGGVAPAAGDTGRESTGFEPDSVVVDAGTENLGKSDAGFSDAGLSNSGTAGGPADGLKSSPAEAPDPAASPAIEAEIDPATAGALAGVPGIAEPAQSDPQASNQNAGNELDQAGNDDRSQTEANRTLGQVIDLFA